MFYFDNKINQKKCFNLMNKKFLKEFGKKFYKKNSLMTIF